MHTKRDYSMYKCFRRIFAWKMKKFAKKFKTLEEEIWGVNKTVLWTKEMEFENFPSGFLSFECLYKEPKGPVLKLYEPITFFFALYPVHQSRISGVEYRMEIVLASYLTYEDNWGRNLKGWKKILEQWNNFPNEKG